MIVLIAFPNLHEVPPLHQVIWEHIHTQSLFTHFLDRSGSIGNIPIFMYDSRPGTETCKMAEPRSNTNTGIELESTLVYSCLDTGQIDQVYTYDPIYDCCCVLLYEDVPLGIYFCHFVVGYNNIG